MTFDHTKVKAEIEHMIQTEHPLIDSNSLKTIFSLIDLTSLKSTDNADNITKMVEKVNRFKTHFPEMPQVAAICIYPSMVETVKSTLRVDKVQIAAVSAGFPSSQTFISVKAAETELAVAKGANEIDIVISLGRFLAGDYDYVANEIRIIKESMPGAHLKVILESGLIPELDQVFKASVLSIEAGADFIKTSTGKEEPAATLEAIYVMCHAIKQHYEKTGKMIGLKPAGGIATSSDAIAYYAVVKSILGSAWLNNQYFRIGASRLANDLIQTIEKMEQKPISPNYF
jgi:deoxyribose-phosphate aldolase